MKYTTDVIYFKDKTGKLIMVNEAHAKGLGLASGIVQFLEAIVSLRGPRT